MILVIWASLSGRRWHCDPSRKLSSKRIPSMKSVRSSRMRMLLLSSQPKCQWWSKHDMVICTERGTDTSLELKQPNLVLGSSLPANNHADSPLGGKWRFKKCIFTNLYEMTGHGQQQFDVMLSYPWADQHRIRFIQVFKIRDKLRERGAGVWIHVECMHGNIFTAMANAILSSTVFVACISPAYERSVNSARFPQFKNLNSSKFARINHCLLNVLQSQTTVA
ncbi:hypothetical protein BJ742DRAFT_571754 [Cladochytrium replicatum]|nr:hypothetical protein BJ742DRAFT_571754 [Cladochytrium replicatum]